MNCLRHKIKNQSPLGKRANPRVSRICQILSPLGFFDPSASRIRSRIPLGLALGPPRFSARTPLVTLSDTLVRPSDARWDLENPRGLKSAEMEPCHIKWPPRARRALVCRFVMWLEQGLAAAKRYPPFSFYVSLRPITMRAWPVARSIFAKRTSGQQVG